MNDLETLRSALLPDEPSQDVIDRSRHRLLNRMLGGSAPRRPIRLLVVKSGITAAAVAGVVAAAAISLAPGAPTDGPQASRTVSGQDVLLAAATAAERAPEKTGTYWHVKWETTTGTMESWQNLDGHLWTRNVKNPDPNLIVEWDLGPAPFKLCGVDLTFDQLRALPTSPDALKAWIDEALKRSPTARTGSGSFTAAQRDAATRESLISLVSLLPSPPAVRAAAFRAIAAYPGVQNLGEEPGGTGLLLPDGHHIVVDPATGKVNRTSVIRNEDGTLSAAPGSGKVTAEWTDVPPK